MIKKHLMMDFETLGLTANAPIVQIGAVYFDPDTGRTYEEISIQLILGDVLAEGFTVEASTLLWWMSQSEEARGRVLTSFQGVMTARTAVSNLTEFMREAEVVWSHLTLDAMLLSEYQNRLGITPSIPYHRHQDLRTLKELAGLDLSDFPSTGVKHNALDDCHFQVQYCVAALKVLKERRESYESNVSS